MLALPVTGFASNEDNFLFVLRLLAIAIGRGAEEKGSRCADAEAERQEDASRKYVHRATDTPRSGGIFLGISV